jgi:uncharacterized protein (TIGR00369 family)
MSSTELPNRREAIRAFLPQSPLPNLLGIELGSLGNDRAVLTLPFRSDLTTLDDVVHGGAIATLFDTAGMAGAWSNDVVPPSFAGSTIALSLVYASAARSEDLTATAEVIHRGRSLCFVDVTIRGADERVVTKGQITYRYGS